MYIINKDVFDKLPEEAQSTIEAEGKSVNDEEKIKEIDEIAAEIENDENNMDDVTYGDEDEYSAKMDADGRMEDMPESKKNEIKSFDDAHEMGNALIRKLGDMPMKKDKVEPIPTNKKAPDEKKVVE